MHGKRVDRRFIHAEHHFLNEITTLSSYKHVNIVSLIGFWDEYDKKILVKEFVTKGSLERYLHSVKLTWPMRLQICLGAARGLSYLHREVRSKTILLDRNWQAKIAGVGGAPGYIDPNPIYSQTGVLTKESDVYSFGVVLFEVLCGRLAYETNDDNKLLLGPLALLRYKEGKLNEIIDPIQREQMNPLSLQRFSAVAYECLKSNRSQRPSMIQVMQRLEQVLGLQQEFEKAMTLQQVALGINGKEDEEDYKVKNLEHMKIPLEQIKLATNDFHDDFKIGRGGYGNVYKADLFHFDVLKYFNNKMVQDVCMVKLLGYQRRRSTVAVKRLDRRYGQGTTEFLQEISVLPYFRHQNLVKLVGFCDEARERILVYEYASNGSLDEYISSIGNRNNHTNFWPE